MVIAVAGKGGVGKSTISALIVRRLLELKNKPVLAVDADPNSTLGDKLGVLVDCTIGDLREEAMQQKHEAPAGVPKQRAIENQVQQAIMEGSGFDLLVMGRGEGPGCYCSVNNMLRAFLENLSVGYKHIIIDNEAGMEHLSRRTNAKIDLMLVVCDPTPTGMMTARRIAGLAKSLGVVRGKMGLVINRSNTPVTPETSLDATGLELQGCVPEDTLVQEFELNGKPILGLPAESLAVNAVNAIMANNGL